MDEDEPGASYWSRVGFSIELPSGWVVVEDDDARRDALEDAREYFALWLDEVWLPNLSAEEALDFRWGEEQGPERLVMLMRQPRTRVRASRALMLTMRVSDEQREAVRAERLGIRTGFVRAVVPARPLASITVRRYRLPRCAHPLEFYKAAKPNPRGGGRGPRVPRTFTVDGLEAVRAYRDFGLYRDRSEEWPKYLDHYFCAGRDAWVIEIGCDRTEFDGSRSALVAIVASLQRTGPSTAYG